METCFVPFERNPGEPEKEISAVASGLVAELRAAGMRITFAESCTGGLAAKCLTDVPGASDVFECGFVTYSNVVKTKLLGVDPAHLAAQGPVNCETAVQMAVGARLAAEADLAVSVTGVAGPGPDGPHPEGEIYIALCDGKKSYVTRLMTGTTDRREYNRQTAALCALTLAEEYINGSLKEG